MARDVRLASERLEPVSGGQLRSGDFQLVFADFTGEALDALEDCFGLALQVEDGDFDCDVLVGSRDVVNRRMVFAIGVDEDSAG